MRRTIMIMAGGTGGHVFPGLAVAACLRERGWRVVWVGARGGMEAGLVPRQGYEMAWVNFTGLRRKGPLAVALLPARLLVAFWQAARAIFAHRPDVVLGMGGFQSFPGGMMAALFGRPLVIHEQNSVPGLANRVLAGVADRILCAFPDTLKKAQVTGNPVRPEIAALGDPAERYGARRGPLQLLVLGGSRGAQALNEAVPRAIGLIAPELRPAVTHQAGAAHLESLAERYRRLDVRANAVDFIDDMASAYAAADLVLARAGALTVAELAAAGVASVLVPYPYAVDDHQTRNARHLADRGAAVLLPENEVSPQRLAALLSEMARPRLAQMASLAHALAKPEAARALAEACVEAAR